jgi:cell division transport system ATP-binding protein
MNIVDLQHLSYSFGDSWALQNISFSMAPGEFLFLTGPSGAGKTTLLRLLYGALPLERGAALVAGFSLKHLAPAKLPLLRREVSVVFQDFRIMPKRSVYENVAIALEVRGMPRQLIERRVRAVLRGLSLERKSAAPAEALSGGEQQRVAIARAIVVNPKILLADEPTGNLDPRLSLRIMELFFHFNRHGTTIILATHNPELIASLPKARVVALRNGQMIEAEDDPTARAAVFCPPDPEDRPRCDEAPPEYEPERGASEEDLSEASEEQEDSGYRDDLDGPGVAADAPSFDEEEPPQRPPTERRSFVQSWLRRRSPDQAERPAAKEGRGDER